jgi:hypothetical protein
MITNTNTLKKVILVLVASTAGATGINLASKQTLSYYAIPYNEYFICGLSFLITIGTAWLLLRKKHK